MESFKHLFESEEYLIFRITDSAWFGGHTQYLLDDMKLSYAMIEDMTWRWRSSIKLNPRAIKILKKEIESQLPHDMESDAYKFTTRKY